MDNIVNQLKALFAKPLVAAAAGFLIGLIIGLPILGWWLMPVQWTDASAQHLRMDLKQDYLKMAIQAYSVDKDDAAAIRRWQELGPEAKDILTKLMTDKGLKPEAIALFSEKVQNGKPVVAVPQQPGQATQPAAAQPTAAPATSDGGVSPILLLGLMCVLLLVIGGALAYLLVFRKKKLAAGPSVATPVAQAMEINKTAQRTDYTGQGDNPPVAQFMTTYMVGDDLYDDSFSIDSPSGEFLGECGVGISDTVGVGDPKKVTAFEVWLFDKNDIQTVTKVLMSEHAFNNPEIRQRLASKGEPVLVEPGAQILLETQTLMLEARVVDMNYGQGALPSNSFYERLTLELAVWQKK
jgi:hypothetical protein